MSGTSGSGVEIGRRRLVAIVLAVSCSIGASTVVAPTSAVAAEPDRGVLEWGKDLTYSGTEGDPHRPTPEPVSD